MVKESLEQVQEYVEKLQIDFQAYRETAEEIHQAYIHAHEDNWTLEEALRQITVLGDIQGIARNALETVWKRREERGKSR